MDSVMHVDIWMFYGLMVIWIAHMLINWYAGVLFTLYMWRDPIKQNYNFIPIEALITILIFTMAAVSQIAAVINGNREHESKPTRPNETTAA
ncbi:uncharacterized protein LOC115634495 isoform X2 [Scaptodrosophila lebanonensis]|uniref:Uncharacterized protein LOC115620172 isoform X2 n=1 Tax=Drosophila lebanonensis TaxID=7225 RepID=A0A6J2T2Q4_DROLE|nr:uncharacterized protein LOC115620172 isoform X2 [Scaptodrosophila lebanonensis]XP_030369163.1 uncharacterized protein LOC115620172 isoform X2 [Scaptodrosophila lebanonensis]XP_030388113.1 uncharacterized protein LOC115634495 isoform X2 [Scaptodrosophila lebanonensis]XP_030388114.1 uncharacterized protein LOC115634495 isoform X2 [Scaptodrosophila lebanonensis]